MDLSPRGAAFVRHHEGFVPRYYLDPVRVPTIGIGFTWRSDAFRSWWARNRPGQAFGPGATMTRAEAEDALVYLMREEYGAAVNRFLGKPVAQHVFDGMSSVVFNAGAGTLTDRWAEAMKRGDISAAADLLKTTRVTAKGKRLAGLVSRRLDEAELIELADYTIGRPRGTQIDPMADGMLVRGERGDAVRQLQGDLQDAGFYADGILDGVFGPGTEAAVMEFQRSAGLDDDGFAGPLTLAALAKAKVPIAAPVPTPRPAGGGQPNGNQPQTPAAHGVEGGGQPEGNHLAMPDKPLTPIEQMNKPVGGAIIGSGVTMPAGAAFAILLSSAGWLPEAWMEGTPAIAFGIFTGWAATQIGNFVGAYRARDKRFITEG